MSRGNGRCLSSGVRVVSDFRPKNTRQPCPTANVEALESLEDFPNRNQTEDESLNWVFICSRGWVGGGGVSGLLWRTLFITNK